MDGKSPLPGFVLPSKASIRPVGEELQAPRPFQAREAGDPDEYDFLTAQQGDNDGPHAPTPPGATTNFSAWTEGEIKSFLDRRGEDHDDCTNFEALVKRAVECEATLGPATRPGTASGWQQGDAGKEEEEEEEDPLDAFMAEIKEVEKTQQAQQTQQQQQPTGGVDGGDAGLDEEYDVADYLESAKRMRVTDAAAAVAVAAAGAPAGGGDSDEEVYAAARAADTAAGYKDSSDEDAATVGGTQASLKRHIEPLTAIDHNSIEYANFAKDFYQETPEVAAMSSDAVSDLRRSMGVKVSGLDPPKPVVSFSQLRFDAPLAAAVVRAGYEKPTAVQAQALPAALTGRDVLVGIPFLKTNSKFLFFFHAVLLCRCCLKSLGWYFFGFFSVCEIINKST
jgi:hypothetical protein